MHKVKRRGNGSNTFGRGWGSISPTSPPPPPKIAGFWGDLPGGGEGDAPGRRSGRERGGRVGGRGRKGACASPGNVLVAPARLARQASCRASACGATEVPRHCPVSAAVAQRCTERQRGSPVTPHALARQRLLVAPGALARPNGLWGANIP